MLGNDPVSGNNFDHRKQWIKSEPLHLCHLSNHFHLVLWSRPYVVAAGDDSQVVRRRLMRWSKRNWGSLNGVEVQHRGQFSIDRLVLNEPMGTQHFRTDLSPWEHTSPFDERFLPLQLQNVSRKMPKWCFPRGWPGLSFDSATIW